MKKHINNIIKHKEEIESIGSKCLFVKADLFEEKDCRNIIKLTDENFGKIDSLINDFRKLEKISGKPKCIIANTIKNNGVPIWEKEHIHMVSGEKLFDGIKESRKLLKNV